MTATREKKELRGEPGQQTEVAAPPRPQRLRWLLPAIGLVIWLVVGGAMGGFASKTAEVQKNDNASFLPESAEATVVLDLSKKFAGLDVVPAQLVYGRDSGLTEADKTVIAEQLATLKRELGSRLADVPLLPRYSDDGKAAQVTVLFTETDAQKNMTDVTWIRDHTGLPDGLNAHVGGLGGILTDMMEVFGSIDGLLLGVTVGIIGIILLIVYRSPILPVVVLVGAGLAFALANGVVYLLAKEEIITVSGQSQAILDVLVLGAATDYAMLLVSRFREELRHTESRYDAMRVALRASFEPILASGATVILGLLCLLVSDLASNKGLGPVGAIGIASSLAVSLTLLPAILALLGRAAFWPVRPKFDSAPVEQQGIWAKVSALVGRRARLVWIGTAVLLLAGVAGLTRLDADGIPQSEGFTGHPDSVSAQELTTAHFPGGTGNPAEIVTRAEKLDQVLLAVRQTTGVAEAAPFTGMPVMPVVPPAGDGSQTATPGQTGATGQGAQAPVAVPPLPEPKVVDGMVRIDATLTDAADSPAALATVERLRAAVHAIDGAQAKVGGFSAINYDVQHTSQRDRNVIIPLVLGVIFLILMVLLRSLIAPLLLIATVVLSYLATLGISGIVFKDVLGFAGADSSYPLFAFVFLVALGVDYNIFLMTRVREEAGKLGHTAGTLKGLAVTGGVITSAGVVLAATFAALAVLPLVFVVEIAFAVAFGVLLDTLLVRSLLVPALTVDIGRFVWWPGRLWRAGEPEQHRNPQ
ncbi:MMPL family transporter [Catellatospora chokoriensis]|uniref:Putative membrane protein n=2 Tax=Catellatospora chokoriensis TaxID=310353 RepID=A0A8J3JUD4_9ACTN|nr:putative membrane protein [Catellatospora chokoriensis]